MPVDIAPGVSEGRDTASSAEEAASRVAALAERAAAAGSFGIGGILIRESGEIIAESVNVVIRGGHVCDPTAHAERQLIDWYYANKRRLNLPPPSELKIISSLEPCAMCTGAILKSGIRAVSVVEDGPTGVLSHLEKTRLFGPEFRLVAKYISRFQVDPSLASENGTADRISAPVYFRCRNAFSRSLSTIRSTVADETFIESTLVGLLGKSSGRVVARQALDFLSGDYLLLRSNRSKSDLVTVKVSGHTQEGGNRSSRAPFAFHEIADLLRPHMSGLLSAGKRLAVASDDRSSPIRTSVLELIRMYTNLRRHAAENGQLPLPAPRVCSFAQLNAPTTFEDALLEFGAMGSFLEAPRLKQSPPLLLYVRGNQAKLNAWIKALPPFYTDLGISASGLSNSVDRKFATAFRNVSAADENAASPKLGFGDEDEFSNYEHGPLH